MAYDPRTIAYFVELLHPPVNHDPARLQELHGELFQESLAGYKNFALIPGGASLSNPPSGPRMISSLTFLPDRLQVREELSGISLDDFCSRLERVHFTAVARTGVAMFSAQQCVVRTLVNPRHYKDSRDFLARSVFRFQQNEMQEFGRPVQMLGLRFVFPKTTPRNEIYSLRMESYNNDPRSLYLENVGTFAPLVDGGKNAVALAENLRETYRFVTEEVLRFVGKFDTQEEKR